MFATSQTGFVAIAAVGFAPIGAADRPRCVLPHTNRFQLGSVDKKGCFCPKPDARLIDFQNTIFGQDQPVLESQRPKRLPLRPDAEVHSAADRMSAAYRRYLKESGIGFGVIA